MPTVESGNGPWDVVVALLIVAGIVIPSVLAWLNSRRTKKDIQTNHGKKPYEYLEMVNDVHEGLIEMRTAQLDMRQDQLDMKDMLADHAKALADHTDQDAERFDGLRELISELHDKDN